jgi:hypothetical protein
MTEAKPEPGQTLSTVRYIQWLFEPSDKVAILVRHRERGETAQRITTAARVVEESFQYWMHFRNEKQSADVYIGMNPLKPEARSRKKEDIQSIRHLYLDLDQEASQSLAAIEQSGLIPSPNVVIATSPRKLQVVWRADGFVQDQGEAMLRALARKFGADPAATDVTRVLRLPGFVNRKYEPEFTVTARVLSDCRHTPHDFQLRTDSFDLDRRFLPTPPAAPSSCPRPLSQSEHDWAYAKRSLAKGAPAEEVIRQIAAFRAPDKHNPEDYARRTVSKADAQLRTRRHLSSGDRD